MIAEAVLVDTGPLVAILHRHDHFHVRCVEQSAQLAGPVMSCWPVVTEAAWLLRDVPDGLSRLLAMISEGVLSLLELEPAAAVWINKHASQFSTLRPQLADLSLVYLAHRDRVRHIFTLDRRDFAVYRDWKNGPFLLLPDVL